MHARRRVQLQVSHIRHHPHDTGKLAIDLEMLNEAIGVADVILDDFGQFCTIFRV